MLRSPLTAPAVLNEFCSDYTHGYFRGQFKAKISVLTQIQRTQFALRRISSHPCRLPSCRNSDRAPVTNGCFFFVILSLKVTVIGENVTRTSLLYDKRLLNAVFITRNQNKPDRFIADVRRQAFKIAHAPLLCFFFFQLLFVGKMRRTSGEKVKSRVG